MYAEEWHMFEELQKISPIDQKKRDTIRAINSTFSLFYMFSLEASQLFSFLFFFLLDKDLVTVFLD